jgi:ppGpp synthetase/RelA/SpoT-type nucleotidyltranferase
VTFIAFYCKKVYDNCGGVDMHNEVQRLDLFELIDETTWLLLDNKPIYAAAAARIIELLTPMLYKKNSRLVGIKSRIKSADSLKEKIIRRQLYKKYNTAEKILENLSDTLGIMIECKFIDDEEKIFNLLRKHFNIKVNEKLYTSKETQNLYLDLDMTQPQMQKNGYTVYRVDGVFVFEEKKVKFEIQLKSLVNAFWSEVEHELVYKNNQYVPSSSLITELLFAIKGNLEGIDKMLQLLANKIEEHDVDRTDLNNTMGYSSFVAKIISDFFCKKMLESIGFTVDFKKTCEILGVYIMERLKERSGSSMSKLMMQITNQFSDEEYGKVNFEEQIVFEGKYIGDDRFSEIVGNSLIKLINIDFEWHLFFKMLFEIEPGNNLEDFTIFIKVIRDTITHDEIYEPLYEKFGQENGLKMKDDILVAVALGFANDGRIKMIYQDTLRSVRENLKVYVENISSGINSFEEWVENVELNKVNGEYFQLDI